MPSASQLREAHYKKSILLRRFSENKKLRQASLASFIMANASAARHLMQIIEFDAGNPFESPEVEEACDFLEERIAAHMLESLGIEYPPNASHQGPASAGPVA
jgi:hypothetical protein